ncbi:VOC family protein [Paraburkholderia bonniea]|uniref:VOC family protein n=1 Tax=Paraburkholderia bonniea TaxID=2152891 RepID=UPI0012912CE4|nr:VOC family protein [Paraburkholderia bonniea]WJF90102.1 VOC family protein [Paraburkholderia bonniea]WJF93416.1 VOC family protein [Paraburkholderia bonniea]
MKISIRDIDHVVLRTSALDAMQQFYCTVLGCTLEKVQPDLGLVQLRAGRALIDLLRSDSPAGGRPQTGHNLDHLCLRVEPFDGPALTAHLAAHGAQPGAIAERYGADGFGPSLYLRDPDGNTIELKGPPQAAWPTAAA